MQTQKEGEIDAKSPAILNKYRYQESKTEIDRPSANRKLAYLIRIKMKAK